MHTNNPFTSIWLEYPRLSLSPCLPPPTVSLSLSHQEALLVVVPLEAPSPDRTVAAVDSVALALAVMHHIVDATWLVCRCCLGGRTRDVGWGEGAFHFFLKPLYVEGTVLPVFGWGTVGFLCF